MTKAELQAKVHSLTLAHLDRKITLARYVSELSAVLADYFADDTGHAPPVVSEGGDTGYDVYVMDVDASNGLSITPISEGHAVIQEDLLIGLICSQPAGVGFYAFGYIGEVPTEGMPGMNEAVQLVYRVTQPKNN